MFHLSYRATLTVQSPTSFVTISSITPVSDVQFRYTSLMHSHAAVPDPSWVFLDFRSISAPHLGPCSNYKPTYIRAMMGAEVTVEHGIIYVSGRFSTP